MRAVVILCLMAVLCWCVMFYPPLAAHINFWGGMAVAAGILALCALWLGRAELREPYRFEWRWVWIGLAATVLLYGVFWVGEYLASSWFHFARSQVDMVYSRSEQAGPWVIGSLLLLWIGPAEEVFWRGFVQQRLMKKLGGWPGFITATVIYSGVHAWSGNFMLVMAALVAGLAWGLMLLRFRNLWPGIISHALWDLVIFVLLPIR